MQTAEGFYFTDSVGGTNCDPVVLIHGVGGSHLIWPAAMRKVKGRRVLAVDLPGHGRSEGSAFRSARQYSPSLDAILKTAGVFRAIFVGYSLGGQVAMQYCLDHPDQCAGLGIIASAFEPAVPVALIELLNDPMAGAEINRLTRSLVFWPDVPPRRAFDLERQLFTAHRGTLNCDWQAFKSFSHSRFEEALPQVPLWVCAARGDRLVPPLKARLMIPHGVQTRWDLVEQCGHGLMVEQPEQVSNAFLSWLAEIRKLP